MSTEKLKILVVDDEIYARVLIKAYLAPYQVEIIEAKDGKEAMEILKADSVDLIILDYTMPVLNGLEVLNRMQLDKNLVKIPVVVYTAGGFEEEIERWLKTAAAAFVEKANLGEDLIPTLKDILGDRLKRKD